VTGKLARLWPAGKEDVRQAIRTSGPCLCFGHSDDLLYVANRYFRDIMVFSSRGTLICRLDVQRPGKASYLTGVAIHPQNFLYVANTHDLDIWTLHGTFVGTCFDWPFPTGITFDYAGRLVMGNHTGHKVVVVEHNLVPLNFPGVPHIVCTYGDVDFPSGVAGSLDGDLCVADEARNCIHMWDNIGSRRCFGTSGDGEGQFRSPDGVAFDGDGTLYVADTDNSRIQTFRKDGTFLCQWKCEETFLDTETPWRPHGLAFKNGELYVCNYNRIRVFV